MHGQKVCALESHSSLVDKTYRSGIGIIIECDEPQHAVTPGQVAVLWEHDWCLGSGVISATF